MHFQTDGAPRRGSSRKGSRKPVRFEKLTCLDALLPRQRVEITKHDCRQRRCLSLCGNHFELCELPIDSRVRIHMRVEDSHVFPANRDRCRDRESWPPLTLLPRQIDPRHIMQWETTQQRDACIAAVVQMDRFFKVEPPLALHRLNTTRNSRRLVDPLHTEFSSEFLSNVMPACALGAQISFLQSKHIDAWQQPSVCERTRRGGDLSTDMSRPSRQTHQSQL